MLLHAVVLALGQFMIDEFYEAFQGLLTAHIVRFRHRIPSGALSASAGRPRHLKAVIAGDSPSRPLQCAARAIEPGPNRAAGHIQRLRNLAIRESFHVGQHDDDAVMLGQRGQRSIQILAQQCVEKLLFGIGEPQQEGLVQTLEDREGALPVDLCDGEPTRYAPRGARREQAAHAAAILGASHTILDFHDRLIEDTLSTRMAVAALIRRHRPRLVFTSHGSGVHPDHKAVTDIVTHAVFYARLSKWDQVPGGEALADTEPHEIDRLFCGHCRMERPWPDVDFAVDVTSAYPRKVEAIDVYRSVFCGPQAARLERFRTED